MNCVFASSKSQLSGFLQTILTGLWNRQFTHKLQASTFGYGRVFGFNHGGI
jgi:hypothetical protein